jgi:Na+/phosphate symporter
MTTDHWLMIAAIIATSITTLLAPIVGTLVQSRISHPKPAPELSQPKNRVQRISGWLMRFVQSPWFLVVPFLAVPLNIYVLLREFHKAAPITRGSVFLISEAVALIWFSFLNMSVLLAQQSLSRQAELHRKQSLIDEKMLDLVGDLLDRVKQVEASAPAQASPTVPNDSAQGRLRNLLAAIKGLFGD